MRYFLIGCCLVAILAGCGGAPGQIDLVVENASIQQHEEELKFTGEFAVLGSRVDSFIAEDIRVVFKNESGHIVRIIEIGTVNKTGFRKKISVKLDEPPQRVLIRTRNTETDGNLVVQGLNRTENGDYEYFEQDRIS